MLVEVEPLRAELRLPAEIITRKGLPLVVDEVTTIDQFLEAVDLVWQSRLSVIYLPYANPLITARTTDGELVGCVGLERRDRLVYVQSLAVRRDMRKQGIGRALIKQVEKYVNSDDTLIALTLFWNNRFYKACGFTHVSPKFKEHDDIGRREKHKSCTAWAGG